MRKLRRLPWRIPKSHHSQPAAQAPVEVSPSAEQQREIERELQREALNAQPVAFAGGRYVYGDKHSVARPTRAPEIRRKARHPILPLPVVS